MRELISSMRVLHGFTHEEAKQAATAMVSLVEEKFKRGEEIDLGCVKLKPLKVRPRVVHSALTGGRHFIGESVKWTFSWSRKWLEREQPPWSKYF